MPLFHIQTHEHRMYFFLQEEEFMMSLQPPKTPSLHENEKPAAMPMCYYNLLAGRAQRAAGTLSSSPEQAPAAGNFIYNLFSNLICASNVILFTFSAAAGNEEESEVPSRNFLKRQSVLIVDSKSRRKPFRAAPAARRK